jgi:small multidrug resistance pump
MIVYLYLLVAVCLEVAGTAALHASQQFTRPLPLAIMAACYLASFFFLSLTLRVIPVGIAYAIWSGLGVVLITIVGIVMFRQKIDAAAVIGLSLIVAGVVVVNLFSSTIRQ